MLLPLPLLLLLRALSGSLTAVDCAPLTEEEQGEDSNEYDAGEECNWRDKNVDEVLREATAAGGNHELQSCAAYWCVDLMQIARYMKDNQVVKQ